MNDLIKLIDESIELELNVSKLYSLFHKLFPEHGDFWWTLSIEEKNHASLLLTGKQHFTSMGMVPENILATRLEILEVTNYELKFLIDKFSQTPPEEEDAFNLAIQIEESAGELHFQKFMNSGSNNPLEEIFRNLNNDDRDHAKRIKRYKTRFVNNGKCEAGSPSLESAA